MGAKRFEDDVPDPLPLSLVIGFFIAGIGTAIWPPVSSWAAPLACSGTVDIQSDHYTTPSGGSGVSRHILCTSGAGKDAVTDEITFTAIGIAGLALCRDRLRPDAGLRRAAHAPRAPRRGRRSPISAAGSAPAESPRPPSCRRSSARSPKRSSAARPTSTCAASRSTAPTAADPAARLAQLRQLHESGLIDDEDYEAKKAEILSGL